MTTINSANGRTNVNIDGTIIPNITNLEVIFNLNSCPTVNISMETQDSFLVLKDPTFNIDMILDIISDDSLSALCIKIHKEILKRA